MDKGIPQRNTQGRIAKKGIISSHKETNMGIP